MSSAPTSAEYRLVTVLLADLVGHTEIMTRVDPAEWRVLLQTYFSEMVHPIQRFGGTVEKFIGDAIFAVFGVPQSHEDDAERAVRAAAAMLDRLVAFNLAVTQKLGGPLKIRIGIATGQVVVPGDSRGDELVIGELTSLAERLQKQAPANGIVLSERTHRLVTPLVESETLGTLALKGFPNAQAAFVVRRLRTPTEKPPGIGVGVPLVGREDELATLLAARDRLKEGQGQVVALIGEAGLGKSRLLAELRGELGPGITFVEGRCREFAQTTAYDLVVQHLRGYLGVSEDEPREASRIQLALALGRVFGSPPQDVRRALEYLLGVESSSSFEEGLRGHRPDEVRSIVVGAITAFWQSVAARAPLLLAVEDLHCVDSASAVVLSELLKVAEQAPLMLLCNFRPERRSAAWEFKILADRDYPHRYREIRLGPLSTGETEYLASLLLDRLGLPTELGHKVAEQAEGNPFYVEEVVRSLREKGVPVVEDIRLPDTLQGVLQARLDGLAPPTRRVLQVASVIGRTFSLRLLTVVAGGNGRLPSDLSTLQRTEFIFEGQRLPEPQFTFKHTLLREAAYQSLLRDERRDVHRRIGEVLEQEPLPGVDPPLLAHHFVQGEVWSKAFTYTLKAAEAAQALSAFDAALAHYDAAVRIAYEHPESVADRTLVFTAERGRGDALMFLGRSQEAHRHFQELLAHYRTPKIRGQIYRVLGRIEGAFGNLREAQTSLAKALKLLERDRDPDVTAGIYRDLSQISERRRQYAKALEYGQRALQIVEEHGLLRRDIHLVLSVAHFYGGHLDQSVRDAEANLSRAVQTADRYETALARNWLAHILLFIGDIQGAQRQADAALALAQDLGIGVPLAVVHLTMAQLLLEQDRWEDADAVLKSADEIVRRHTLGESWGARVFREQGVVALARGDWDDAARQLEVARSLAEKLGMARDFPKIHRGLAEAHLGRRDFEQAQVHASKVKQYERGGNPIEMPGALRVLAVVARERGNFKRSRLLLEGSRSLVQGRKNSAESVRVLLELAKTYEAAGLRAQAREVANEGVKVSTAIGAACLQEAAEAVAAHIERRLD